MRTPTTTDPCFTLSFEEADNIEPDAQVVPFPFQDLHEKLPTLITARFDMPTRSSFSWTCQKYHASHGDKDFDPFAFADKCAELGYCKLLKYSVDLGGPLDHDSSELALAHGHLGIFQMYAKKISRNEKVNPKVIPTNMRNWAGTVAGAGRNRFLDWLKIDLWQDGWALLGVACGAARSGRLDKALNLFTQAAAYPLEPAFSSPPWLQLLEAACNGGSETVQGVLELVPEGENIDWSQLIRRIFDNSKRASLISWLFERYPELKTENLLNDLVNVGVDEGDVELLRLAERLGATITLDHFRTRIYSFSDKLHFPPVAALRYLHEKFDLQDSPFDPAVGVYPVSISSSLDDVQWMEEHGYKLDFSPDVVNMFVDRKALALLPWIFQRVRSTSDNLMRVASYCRVDLLDILWKVKDDDVSLDNIVMGFFLSECKNVPRFRLNPVLQTFRWLQSKGFTTKSANYDRFVGWLLEKKPRLLTDYWDQLAALNMPLSAEARQRVEDFLANAHPVSAGT